MEVGYRINLFKNVNLKKKPVPHKKGMKQSDWLEDPDKGIVLRKYEGVIIKIFESGEEISFNDILKYSSGNELMKRAFTAYKSRKVKRFVAEFKGPSTLRYRIFSVDMFNKDRVRSIFGYAEVLPNSVQFIMNDFSTSGARGKRTQEYA